MAKEIKQRIVLEGEKQYSAAIKEAQRNIRTFKSEMKAETAELGLNATAQQKAEVAAKSLKKQIAEQEAVVKTCKEAFEQAKAEYGDNAEVVAKWETKLNEARATLAGMKNDFESNASVAISSNKNIMATFDQLASYGESISGTIENVFSTCISGVRYVAAAVFGEITDLAAKANNITDLAGYWNTSTTNIQKWQAAVRGSSNDLADLNTVVQKINFFDDKKIAELTGVSVVGYKDQWEYAMAVMDSMASMSYDQKSKAAEAIFGRSATKAYELLNDWGDIQKLLPRFDVENGGLGMTEEQIAQMNEVSVNLATLKETWEQFKNSFEAGAMGQLAVDLSSNAQGVLDALIEFLNADNESEREAALQKLQDELTSFFTRIGEAITAAAEALDKVGSELQASENGTLRVIGRIISGLGDLLESLSKEETYTKILEGFRMLADFWLIGKGMQLVNTVANFANNLGKITNFHFGNNGGTPTVTDTPTAPTNTGTGSDTGTGVGTGVGIGAALKTFFSSTLAKAAGGAAAFVLTLTDTNGIVPFSGSRNTAHYDQFTSENGELEQWAKDEGYVLLDDGTIWNPNEPTASQKEAQRIANGETKYVETAGFSLPTKRTPHGKVMGYEFTDEQRAVAEDWWDIYRSNPTGDDWDATWDKLEALFTNNEKTFDGFMDTLTYLEQTIGDSVYSSEDLPAFLFTDWQGNITDELQKLQDKPGITSDDIAKLNTLPARIEAAVNRGVSGLKVTIDGRTAGSILAPYVSQEIARDITA